MFTNHPPPITPIRMRECENIHSECFPTVIICTRVETVSILSIRAQHKSIEMQKYGMCTRSQTAKLQALRRVYLKKRDDDKLLTWGELLDANEILYLSGYTNSERKDSDFEATRARESETEEIIVEVKTEELHQIPPQLYSYYVKNYTSHNRLRLEKDHNTKIDLTLDEDEINDIINTSSFGEDYEFQDATPENSDGEFMNTEGKKQFPVSAKKDLVVMNNTKKQPLSSTESKPENSNITLHTRSNPQKSGIKDDKTTTLKNKPSTSKSNDNENQIRSERLLKHISEKRSASHKSKCSMCLETDKADKRRENSRSKKILTYKQQIESLKKELMVYRNKEKTETIKKRRTTLTDFEFLPPVTTAPKKCSRRQSIDTPSTSTNKEKNKEVIQSTKKLLTRETSNNQCTISQLYSDLYLSDDDGKPKREVVSKKIVKKEDSKSKKMLSKPKVSLRKDKPPYMEHTLSYGNNSSNKGLKNVLEDTKSCSASRIKERVLDSKKNPPSRPTKVLKKDQAISKDVGSNKKEKKILITDSKTVKDKVNTKEKTRKCATDSRTEKEKKPAPKNKTYSTNVKEKMDTSKYSAKNRQKEEHPLRSDTTNSKNLGENIPKETNKGDYKESSNMSNKSKSFERMRIILSNSKEEKSKKKLKKKEKEIKNNEKNTKVTKDQLEKKLEELFTGESINSRNKYSYGGSPECLSSAINDVLVTAKPQENNENPEEIKKSSIRYEDNLQTNIADINKKKTIANFKKKSWMGAMAENGDETLQHYKKRIIQQHEYPNNTNQQNIVILQNECITPSTEKTNEENPPDKLTEKNLGKNCPEKENISKSNPDKDAKRRRETVEQDEEESQHCMDKTGETEKHPAPKRRKNSKNNFSHEKLELYKLGSTNKSTSLCKSKDPYRVSQEKFLKSTSQTTTAKLVPKIQLTESILHSLGSLDRQKSKTQTLFNDMPNNEKEGLHNLPQIIQRRPSATSKYIQETEIRKQESTKNTPKVGEKQQPETSEKQSETQFNLTHESIIQHNLNQGIRISKTKQIDDNLPLRQSSSGEYLNLTSKTSPEFGYFPHCQQTDTNNVSPQPTRIGTPAMDLRLQSNRNTEPTEVSSISELRLRDQNSLTRHNQTPLSRDIDTRKNQPIIPTFYGDPRQEMISPGINLGGRLPTSMFNTYLQYHTTMANFNDPHSISNNEQLNKAFPPRRYSVDSRLVTNQVAPSVVNQRLQPPTPNVENALLRSNSDSRNNNLTLNLQNRQDPSLRMYPLTPEISPTVSGRPDMQQTAFQFHPRMMPTMIKHHFQPQQPIKPQAEPLFAAKRPRGRPRLYNTKTRKQDTNKADSINIVSQPINQTISSSFLSPPNTPITPKSRTFSHNFNNEAVEKGQQSYRNPIEQAKEIPSQLQVIPLQNKERVSPENVQRKFSNNFGFPEKSAAMQNPRLACLPQELLVPIQYQTPNVSNNQRKDISEKEQGMEKNTRTKTDCKRVGITADTISRMKSLFCNLEDQDECINETLESLNAQVVNSFRNIFLEYCQDAFVKQMIQCCDLVFQRFVCKLMAKTPSNTLQNGWDIIGPIRIKTLNKEGECNIDAIREKCKNDSQYIEKHFKIEIKEVILRDEVVCNQGFLGPSVIAVVDKYGNYVTTNYPEEQNFSSLKTFEIVVPKEIQKSKDIYSSSSEADEHNENMNEQIAGIIDTLEEVKDASDKTTPNTEMNNCVDVYNAGKSSIEILNGIKNALQKVPRKDQVKLFNSILCADVPIKTEDVIEIDGISQENNNGIESVDAPKTENADSNPTTKDYSKILSEVAKKIYLSKIFPLKSINSEVVSSTSTIQSSVIIEDIFDGDNDEVASESTIGTNSTILPSNLKGPGSEDSISAPQKNDVSDINDMSMETDVEVVDSRIITKKINSFIEKRLSTDTISSTNSDKGVNGTIKRPNEKKEKPSFVSRIPKGKLCYVREQNAFIRYFDETQIHLFIENLKKTDQSYNVKDIYKQCYKDGVRADHFDDSQNQLFKYAKEVINLPPGVIFSNKETLAEPEEYVREYNTVQKHVPQDFFWYYKYVTGYQIYKGNIPISFQTFLTMHNTNGLKMLLSGYISQLERQERGN